MKKPINSKINLLYILFHPIFLTLFFWLLLIYIIPNYFNKYDAEIIDIQPVRETSKLLYHDMDNDGLTEKLMLIFNNGEYFPAIAYYNHKGDVIDQWNLKGKWLNRQMVFFGDFDANGFEEIYCLSRVHDSIYLNIKELLKNDGIEIINRFICKANIFNSDQIDTGIIQGKLMDIDKNGRSEFVFTLWSGFSNSPRKSFAYFINSDSIISSEPSASTFFGGTSYMDCNDDGVEEITGFTAGTNNIHDTILPYTDSVSWLMVIDPAKDFDFIFPPIKYDKIFSSISPMFCRLNNEDYIVAVFACTSLEKDNDGFLLKLFDTKGNIINSKSIENLNDPYISIFPKNIGNKLYLILRNGNIYTTDTSLILTEYSTLKEETITLDLRTINTKDIDDDGEDEHLILSSVSGLDHLIIYRSNLKETTIVELPASRLTNYWDFTLKRVDNHSKPIIVLQADNNVYHIEYSKSNYYYLKFPAYIFTFLFLYLIFWVMQKGQNMLAQRKFETEKKLMRQQMALSKRKLEPHFMLNTLNNIVYMFSKENKEDAQYYFGRFSSLIHRGLIYADQVETSLYEELEFVRDYLILQKQRFNGDLDFSIEAGDEIKLSEINIPHSLVFTFVENAVKHGLRHKISNRKLNIQINNTSSYTEIIITDNGIGRKQSKVLKTTGTGKGLGIVSNIIEGYNKLNNKSISYTVKDLLDDNGDGVGTDITILNI